MHKMKKQKGITLVALIITIIVLLILAVVAIRAVQGDGIIQHAKNAKSEYELAQANESETLEKLINTVEEQTKDEGKKILEALTEGYEISISDAEEVWTYSMGTINGSTGYIITNYNGNDTTVIVPSKIGEAQIIGIADSFGNTNENGYVKNIIISKGIEWMGNCSNTSEHNGVFSKFINLENVKLSDTAQFYCLSSCYNLSSVTFYFPNSVEFYAGTYPNPDENAVKSIFRLQEQELIFNYEYK